MIDFPASPTLNQLFTASNGAVYSWNGTVWVPVGVGGSAIALADTPPSNPVIGQLWWNSDLGQLFIWYDDGTSQQWVPANPTPVVLPANKVLRFTRDPTLATGNVAYTGVGFKPSAILFMGAQAVSPNVGFNGFVDSSRTGFSIFDMAAGQGAQPNTSAFTCGSGANFQSAQVLSYDADGFTLAWTRTGAPGGSAFQCAALCFR